MLIPVYLRGSSYYLRTRVNGVQFKRSLQTNNKAIAIMRASRLMEAFVKIDLSGIRTYEIDLKNGVLKSEGVDDHARMLEALTVLKSSIPKPAAPSKEEPVVALVPRMSSVTGCVPAGR